MLPVDCEQGCQFDVLDVAVVSLDSAAVILLELVCRCHSEQPGIQTDLWHQRTGTGRPHNCGLSHPIEGQPLGSSIARPLNVRNRGWHSSFA